MSNCLFTSLKSLYGQQSFCSVGISIMCEKVFKEKNGFRHLKALISSFKIPTSATPNKVDCESLQKESELQNGSWHHARNCQILLVEVTVVSVVVKSSHWQKTNNPKLAKQCSHQGGKIKTWSVEMFLKWHHSSPIFHYAVNVIGCGQSGNFKTWFYGTIALELILLGFNYRDTKTTKTLLVVLALIVCMILYMYVVLEQL